MKQLTNTEYDEYEKYKRAKMNGRVLTPDGLRLICAAYNYDTEVIGKHFLDVLAKQQAASETYSMPNKRCDKRGNCGG